MLGVGLSFVGGGARPYLPSRVGHRDVAALAPGADGGGGKGVGENDVGLTCFRGDREKSFHGLLTGDSPPDAVATGCWPGATF